MGAEINMAWQFHATILIRKYKVVGDQYVRDNLIMRRKLATGEWRYRIPTEAERIEWFDGLQY